MPDSNSIEGIFTAAVTAENAAERRRILGEGVVRWGLDLGAWLRHALTRAPEAIRPKVEELLAEVHNLFDEWILGRNLSSSAEEDERRARVALEMLAKSPTFVRIAARAVGRLPANHPVRIANKFRSRLESVVDGCIQKGDREGAVLPLLQLLSGESASNEGADGPFLKLALSIAEDVGLPVEARRDALQAFFSWHLHAYIRARDGGEGRQTDPSVAKAHLETMTRLEPQFRQLGPEMPNLLALGLVLLESDTTVAGLEMLAKVSDSTSELAIIATYHEGLARLTLGEEEKAIPLLERSTSAYEEGVILAVLPAEINSYGKYLATAGSALAVAFARAGRWGDAFRTVERTKSPRLRYLNALRRTAAGRELLNDEARIASIRLEVERPLEQPPVSKNDPLAAELTPEVRALEAYRKARPPIGVQAITPPTIEEVVARLRDGEGLISLGLDQSGTIFMGVTHSSSGGPTWCEINKDLTVVTAFLMFQANDDDFVSGWIKELAKRRPERPRPALERMLALADRAVGVPISRFAAEHRLTRVTVVPHRILQAVPYGALPSLQALDLQVAPSVGHWMRWRGEPAKLAGNGVVAGNPTLDLEYGTFESIMVADSLSARGLQVTQLVGSQATGEAMRRSVATASILHFAGHAFSRSTDALNNALQLHPDSRWASLEEDDPLASIATSATTWSPLDDFERHTQTPFGRLTERYDEFAAGQLVERQLDYDIHASIWTEYYEGRLRRIAQLWTTSQMLIDDTLDRCALAVLGACESGRRDLSLEIDDIASIPSSLELAGVNSVVCTLWLVDDLAALVFAHLFYAELTEARGFFDVQLAVSNCRRGLAEMTREELVELLQSLRQKAEGAPLKNLLIAAERRAWTLKGKPFGHPIDWGAFVCYGCDRLLIDDALVASGQ